MTNIKRLSLSVPPELASDLNFISRRMSISKSAVITQLVGQGLKDFRMLLEALPPEPEDTDMKRFRGASAEMITSRMESILHDIREHDEVNENES